ncbi:MAG: hypothetical protein KDC54_20195, partial [Lewinella sp.]|nr:hypothetical protein [Lewinella sp.]
TRSDWEYPRWEALEVVRGELVEHPDILGCRIRVESVTTLGRLFREMPPSPTDAPELVGQERSYWRMHLQSVRRFRERGQEYPFEKRMSCLPSLREFDQAMTAGECRTRHYPEDLLYLHRQPAGRLRALYIGANEPESSVIFDLPGRDGYRTLLREALEVAEEPDERQGWEKLLG